MFCEQCGNEVKEGARFCNKCGAPIQQEVKQDTQRVAGSLKEKGMEQAEAKLPRADRKQWLPFAVAAGVVMVVAVLAVGINRRAEKASGETVSVSAEITDDSFIPWKEAGLEDHVMEWNDEALEKKCGGLLIFRMGRFT